MNFEVYVDANSPIHRLSGRTKVIGTAIGILICLCFDHPLYLAGCVLASGLILVLSRAAGNLRHVWLPAVVFVSGCALSWAFVLDQGTPIWHWGPLQLSVLSVWYGLAMSLRLIAMFLVLLVFASTVQQDELQRALIELRVPYRVAFTVSFAMQLIPGFVGVAIGIMEAQAARGLDFQAGSLRMRMQSYMSLAIPLLMHTVREIDKMTIALESRGFTPDGGRTFLRTDHLKASDKVVIASLALVLCLTVVARIGGLGALSRHWPN